MTSINQLVQRELDKQPFVLTYKRYGQRHTKPFDTQEACLRFAGGMVGHNMGIPLSIKKYGKYIWRSSLDCVNGSTFLDFIGRKDSSHA